MESDGGEENHQNNRNPIDWVFHQVEIDDFHLRGLSSLANNTAYRSNDRKTQSDHKNDRDPVSWVPTDDSLLSHTCQ